MKYRYVVVDLEYGSAEGTNDAAEAETLSDSDALVVIDCETGEELRCRSRSPIPATETH